MEKISTHLEPIEPITRQCSVGELQRLVKHIPPELRGALQTPSSPPQVEISRGPGTGPYQGYTVYRITYLINLDAPHRKVMPLLTSEYSEVLKSLVQVNCILGWHLKD